jgi:hypothetical protein
MEAMVPGSGVEGMVPDGDASSFVLEFVLVFVFVCW